MNKEIIVNGACYTLIAAATPWAQFLGSTQDLSPRMLAATAVASIVAGATALKAFLSTSVAFSQPNGAKPAAGPVAAIIAAGFVGAASLLYLGGCATPLGRQLTAIQDNPAVQAAEEDSIAIGGTLATGSPLFSFVAPVVVNGLTALANGKNPLAVTGTDLDADTALIKDAVAAAIPNSTGKTVAVSIADTYTAAMTNPVLPQNSTSANAVIAAIASGLTTAADTAGAPGPRGAKGKRFANHARWLRERALAQIDRGDYQALLRGQKDIVEMTRIGMTRLEVEASRRDDEIIRENQRIWKQRTLPAVWLTWPSPLGFPTPNICVSVK